MYLYYKWLFRSFLCKKIGILFEYFCVKDLIFPAIFLIKNQYITYLSILHNVSTAATCFNYELLLT